MGVEQIFGKRFNTRGLWDFFVIKDRFVNVTFLVSFFFFFFFSLLLYLKIRVLKEHVALFYLTFLEVIRFLRVYHKSL